MDYSSAPHRNVRCTATTQALHPNDEISAPHLDDSVPCVSPSEAVIHGISTFSMFNLFNLFQLWTSQKYVLKSMK